MNHVENLLKKDKRLWSKDKESLLLKNTLVSLVMADDATLINVLLSDKKTAEQFFQTVGKVTVFRKEKFIEFVTMNEFLPNSFTSFKNKIGLSVDGKYLSTQRDVSIIFPYKDCILEGGQDREDTHRDEVFYNTTLAPDAVDRLKEPKVLTNWKRYTKSGDATVKNVTEKDNLIIKGNNLLALYSLLPRYRGKVKLIYIDPPYGKDANTFYNDNFMKSTWLTFMKNRLEVAHELLSPDGTIFIQISHHNLAELKMVCDEVFDSNLVNIITVKVRSTSGFKVVNPGCFVSAEFLLAYGSRKGDSGLKKLYVEDDYDPAYSKYIPNLKEHFSKWKIISLRDHVSSENGYESYKKMKKVLGEKQSENLISEFALKHANEVCQAESVGSAAGQETLKLREKSLKERGTIFETKSQKDEARYIWNGRELAFYSKKIRDIDGAKVPSTLLTDIWKDISWEGIGGEGDVSLSRGKKPEKLLKRVIDLCTNEGDLVLDFHLGSGTTAAVAHKMKRQYIGVEQLDYGENDPVERMKNTIAGDDTGISSDVGWEGGGEFVYCELLKWNQRYIDDLEKAKTKPEIENVKKKLLKEQFFRHSLELEKFDDAEFKKLDMPEQKRILLDAIDMNHLYVNTDSIDDATFKVNADDKKMTEAFYAQ